MIAAPHPMGGEPRGFLRRCAGHYRLPRLSHPPLRPPEWWYVHLVRLRPGRRRRAAGDEGSRSDRSRARSPSIRASHHRKAPGHWILARRHHDLRPGRYPPGGAGRGFSHRRPAPAIALPIKGPIVSMPPPFESSLRFRFSTAPLTLRCRHEVRAPRSPSCERAGYTAASVVVRRGRP